MQQYKDLLKYIIESPDSESVNTRSGETIKVFGYQNRYDLRDGFPILTTKKVHFKSIFYELIWFISGRTDLRYLLSNNVRIWNDDAHRVYKEKASKLEDLDHSHHIVDSVTGKLRLLEMDEFIDRIKTDSDFNNLYGNMGPIYGKQWRSFGDSMIQFDQLKNAIETIKKDPMNRRIIVSAWNPNDISKMVLPPCHLLFQFGCSTIPFEKRMNMVTSENATPHIVRYCETLSDSDKEIVETILESENIPRYYLDVQLYQRSADSFLGVPFNITSYALLLEIVGKLTNTIPRHFVHTFGDLHIYKSHLNQVDELMKREPKKLPSLKFNKDFNSIEEVANLVYSDVTLENYEFHPPIKADVSVG